MKSIKGAKGKSIKEGEQKRNDDISLIDEDDDMGSSFLQYWCGVNCILIINYNVLTSFGSAMCEKQIIVPNNAILYCSERYKVYCFIFLCEHWLILK